nr:MAG TPA: hypothetical protein [Caudoviricetes sp.]
MSSLGLLDFLNNDNSDNLQSPSSLQIIIKKETLVSFLQLDYISL